MDGVDLHDHRWSASRRDNKELCCSAPGKHWDHCCSACRRHQRKFKQLCLSKRTPPAISISKTAAGAKRKYRAKDAASYSPIRSRQLAGYIIYETSFNDRPAEKQQTASRETAISKLINGKQQEEKQQAASVEAARHQRAKRQQRSKQTSQLHTQMMTWPRVCSTLK